MQVDQFHPCKCNKNLGGVIGFSENIEPAVQQRTETGLTFNNFSQFKQSQNLKNLFTQDDWSASGRLLLRDLGVVVMVTVSIINCKANHL